MVMLLKTMTTGHEAETDKRRRQVRGREYRDGWICDGWMLTLEWFQGPAIQSSVHVRLLKLSDAISSRLLLIWRRFFRYTPSAVACHTLHYLEEEEAGNLISREGGWGLFSPVPRKGSLTRHGRLDDTKMQFQLFLRWHWGWRDQQGREEDFNNSCLVIQEAPSSSPREDEEDNEKDVRWEQGIVNNCNRIKLNGIRTKLSSFRGHELCLVVVRHWGGTVVERKR